MLSVVGKVFCKIFNNKLVQCLDKKGALHEGQAGFRIIRSCTDNVYTLNEIVQGKLREDFLNALFYIYRRPVILGGVMVCGINCGTGCK